MMKRVLYMVSFAAVFFGWGSALGQGLTPEITKISAMELLYEYDNNSVWETAQKYKGRTLVVDGRVASIDNQGFRMLLGSHMEFRIVKAGMAHRVSATDFPPGEMHVFPENRTVILVCQSEGHSYGYPILGECVEVKP